MDDLLEDHTAVTKPDWNQALADAKVPIVYKTSSSCRIHATLCLSCTRDCWWFMDIISTVDTCGREL